MGGMFRNPTKVFALLCVLTVGLILVDLPQNYRLSLRLGPLAINRTINPIKIDVDILGVKIRREFKTRLGLDLSGGTHLVLEADMQDVKPEDRVSALDSARQVIERRVNFFGVTEPIVQLAHTQANYRIIVELPGITDVEKAVVTIGQTARLEFREFTNLPQSTDSAAVYPTLTNTTAVDITGKDLRRASLEFSTQTGEPEVGLEFTDSGAKKFAQVTRRLVGQPLAIFLDEVALTWPRVNTEITDGRAVITGNFTQEIAKTLALQLNAGALPVPVSVVEKRTVGATLGAESVQKSVRAGMVGLAIVAGFMVAKYGWLGVLADLALILYGLLTLALFRFIPVTLTLPGVAGFILSIGMAVDSNILIFERYKEEVRRGKPWKIALELGFGKAWDSIRVANFTTLITCLILFNPGNWELLPASGMVRGFAVTLFIGVLTSLFTGIVVTRTLIRVLYRGKSTV